MKKFIVTYLNEKSNSAHKQFNTLNGVLRFANRKGLTFNNDIFVTEFKDNDCYSTDITDELQELYRDCKLQEVK